ncbi:MAG: alpha/beta hydrolase [Ekhidna sp.]
MKKLFLVLIVLSSCLSLKQNTVSIDNDTYQYVLEGQGHFTIILESGLGDDMNTWDPIYNRLTKHARVLAYNRSGYGKSNYKGNKDAQSVAQSLKTLLHQENIEGQLILVGHSLGGQYSLAFAKEFQSEIAGVILIDSRHPEFTKECEKYDAGFCKAPRIIYSLWGEHTREEYNEEATNSNQLVDLSFMERIPLTVISRTKTKGMESEKFKLLWYQAQRDLASQSELSKFVEASNSGHYIHKDQPSLVVKEILLLIHRLEQ